MRPFRRIVRASYAATAIAGLVWFVALILLDERFFVPVCTGGILILFSGLAYPFWYRSIGRQYDREIGEILSGRHWARWRYSSDDWTRMTETEWKLAKTERLSRLAKPLVIFALLVALIPGCIGFAVPTILDPSLLGITGFAAILILAIVFASTGSPLWAWVQWRLRSSQVSGEIYLGLAGIFEPKWIYTPLRGPGVSLKAVEIIHGEYPVIAFVTEHLTSGLDRFGLYPETPRRVFIPASWAHGASEIVSRYQDEFQL